MFYLDQYISVSEAMNIPIAYDYENQAWVKYGLYVECGHSVDFPCKCYGRIHSGELVAANADLA